MNLELVSPLRDPRVAPLLDAAFQRSERESRLVVELARQLPTFDEGLSLLATENGVALGYALFVPRVIELRGARVNCAVAGPIGVHPAHQRRGVGRFLLRTGLGALRDRGVRAAMVIGAGEFYGAFGFESAFNAYGLRVPLAALPLEGDTSSWRGLTEHDLAPLVDLQATNYAGVDGSELRHAAAVDWESAVAHAHTLVSARDGEPEAFLRFRVRVEIELGECGARDARGVDSILRFLRRVAREHRRTRIEAHVPPTHPVARELARRGAVSEANQLGGAARLCVVDWPGLLGDTRASWCEALHRARVDACSLGIGESSWRMQTRGNDLAVSAGRDARHHVEVPTEWSSGLLTGQRDFRDLVFAGADVNEPGRPELLAALFPGGTPMWTYSPVFEIADE